MQNLNTMLKEIMDKQITEYPPGKKWIKELVYAHAFHGAICTLLAVDIKLNIDFQAYLEEVKNCAGNENKINGVDYDIFVLMNDPKIQPISGILIETINMGVCAAAAWLLTEEQDNLRKLNAEELHDTLSKQRVLLINDINFYIETFRNKKENYVFH